MKETLNTAIIADRSRVRFLKSKTSGMWHQKAIDLDLPPSAPMHIFLNSSSGIEPLDDEDESGPSSVNLENEEPDLDSSTSRKDCGDS